MMEIKVPMRVSEPTENYRGESSQGKTGGINRIS